MNAPARQETQPAPAVTTQPLERLTSVVERVVCGVAWATQAVAATAYTVAIYRPAAWQPTLDKDPVDVAFMWLFGICMTLIWAISLWDEQRRFYDRRTQRGSRRVGLSCHLGVLLIATLAVAGSPHRIGWWAVLALLCFCAIATWGSWMQARLLPDEDQAVIDAIIHGEAAQRAAVYDASEREKRRVRLTAIVESLGYTLTDAPPVPAKPAETPAIRWTIPAGKHAPLVYFIRNGNRLKIGTTTELKRRIRTLALRPENVALLVDGDRRREHEYHKQFAEHRIGATEWFAYEGTLVDFVHEQAARISREERGQ
jgi:hypothetical protein